MTEPITSRTPSAGRDLPMAILVGCGLLAVIAVTLLWFHWGFIFLCAVAFSFAAVELTRALRQVGFNASFIPIIVGIYIIQLDPFFSEKLNWLDAKPGIFLLTILGLTVLAALIWRMPKGPEGYVRDVSASLFIIGYLGLLSGFIPLMFIAPDGPKRLICFLLCVVASDTGGYAVGAWCGKHQLAPIISPKKTWEGLAGSGILAIVVGSLAVYLVLDNSWWVGALLGAVVTVCGTVGDLIESLIKRDLGIKDMSRFLPGHGGLMDRLDSILVAAPAAWLVLYYLISATR